MRDKCSILAAVRSEALTGLHVFFAPATAVARFVLSAFHDPRPTGDQLEEK